MLSPTLWTRRVSVKFVQMCSRSLLEQILEGFSESLDGFSASSLFEAKAARQYLDKRGEIHYTSPGLRADEIDQLCKLSNYISFNSMSQWKRFKSRVVKHSSAGIRINPKISFVKDDRFNPSEKYSKLGVPIDVLASEIKREFCQFEGLEGVHFHTNCESSDFNPLLETVIYLDRNIGQLLKQTKWINLGGGYYFNDDMDYGPFEEEVYLLKDKYGLKVIVEPGAALVQEAGTLTSSVVDLFESDGKMVVVLDTTVNHLPEVLEFGYSPEVEGSTEEGEFEYILSGASCLAGDKFGVYRFSKSLELGSKITFNNVGAYSLVKAHMFNGINLPSVYCKRDDGRIELIKEHTYEDFLDRCGASVSERIRKRA